MTTEENELVDAVRLAAGRADVSAAVGGVYAELMRRIDVRRPRCDASGRCCRFEEFGHRLYVTTVELAAFVNQLSGRSTGVPPVPGVGEGQETPEAPSTGGTPVLPVALPVIGQGGACPYQVGGLCSVHAIRPFGCRVFFCDATATEWQQDQYERLHAELKRLHERLDVPYFYVEWREALRQLGLARS